MLYLIGLGLGDAEDITVKGLEAVRRCRRVYLEAYTSVLPAGREALEKFYGKELILADREMVEQEADSILKDADVCDVAFLVVGDPFGATGQKKKSQITEHPMSEKIVYEKEEQCTHLSKADKGHDTQ